MILQLHKDLNPIVSPLWSCTYYSLTNVKARSLCGLVLRGPAEGLKIWWANIIGSYLKEHMFLIFKSSTSFILILVTIKFKLRACNLLKIWGLNTFPGK